MHLFTKRITWFLYGDICFTPLHGIIKFRNENKELGNGV